MTRNHSIYAKLLGIILLTSCGGNDIAERISTAEMAYATEDASASRRICDEIMNDNNGISNLTASQLGRMSILYMQLFDRTDDADALDKATRCYRLAYDVNNDSASYFFTNLPLEQEKYAMSLSAIVQSVDNPVDVSDTLHETMDSLTH